MVGPDLDGGWSIEEVLSPFFEGKNDGHELFVVDLIVSFRLVEGFGIISERMPLLVLEL